MLYGETGYIGRLHVLIGDTGGVDPILAEEGQAGLGIGNGFRLVRFYGGQILQAVHQVMTAAIVVQSRVLQEFQMVAVIGGMSMVCSPVTIQVRGSVILLFALRLS